MQSSPSLGNVSATCLARTGTLHLLDTTQGPRWWDRRLRVHSLLPPNDQAATYSALGGRLAGSYLGPIGLWNSARTKFPQDRLLRFLGAVGHPPNLMVQICFGERGQQQITLCLPHLCFSPERGTSMPGP